MAAFTLAQSEENPGIFLVVGPDGMPVPTINEFLLHLSNLGRSAYTLRSYAHGLAHFFGWLHTRKQQVDEVTSQTIEAYIAFFSTETKGGACPVDPQKAGLINLRTRKSSPAIHRQPRTINHQLSVLASFFAYHIQLDTERGLGRWKQQANPVPESCTAQNNAHGMLGRDALRRGKAGELRRRVPHHLPRQVDSTLARQLIDTATSWRDKAILTLLYRTGQRIGDWSVFAGRHGILGMTLADVDERAGMIVVFLKGARDEHRVPVTDDFWPLYHHYLQEERRADPSVSALWLGKRKGKGQPLSYASFESSLRYIGHKLGANVNAHMFRHTLAQTLVDLGHLKVAQDILGHQHLETTADIYAQTDQHALVEALSAAKLYLDAEPPGDHIPAERPTAAGKNLEPMIQLKRKANNRVEMERTEPMRAYSSDLRERVIRAVDQGYKRAEIISLFGISRATIKRYRHRNDVRQATWAGNRSLVVLPRKALPCKRAWWHS